MKIILKKLLKDSWQQKAKISYLFLSLVLASFGISTLYYGNIMAHKDFEVNFAHSTPANIILNLPNSEAINTTEIKEHPAIAEIENRPMRMAVIQVDTMEIMKALIIGVENIVSPKLDKFSILENSSPNLQVFLEQNGAQFFDPAFLENIRLLTATNDTIELGQTGFVHDTRLPPSKMEMTIYVYLPLTVFKQYFGAANRLLLKTKKEEAKRATLHKIAMDISEIIKSKYGWQSNIGIPPPFEHPHQNIADGIFYIMKLLGASWSIMGWVFMTLVLLTWLYPQMPDMGTMKSLGATQKAIQTAYLLFVFMISLFAYGIGVIGGYFMAKGFNAFVAFTQNFTPVENPIDFRQQLILAIIGLGTPVLIAFFPIAKITKRSTRFAQNMVFNTHEKSLHWLNNLLPTAQLKYVANNIFKNSLLFLLTIILASIGLSLTFTGFNLSNSLNTEMATLEKERVYDYMAMFDEKNLQNPDLLQSVDFVEDVQFILKENIVINHPLLDMPKKLMLLNINPTIKFSQNRMVLGEWRPSCFDCFYITQNLGIGRDFDKIALGTKMEVQINNGAKQILQYGGILKIPEVYSSAFMPTNKTDDWNVLFINGASNIDQTKKLSEYFVQTMEQNPSISSSAEIRMSLKNHLEGGFFVIACIGIAALLLSIISIIILINLMLIRREKEIGILKSIGASNARVKTLFTKELVLVLSLAILMGGLLSLYMSYQMCFHYGTIVFKVPFPLTFHWIYNLLSIGIYALLVCISVNYQLQIRLAKQSRFLLN